MPDLTLLSCDEDYDPYVPPASAAVPLSTGVQMSVHINDDTKLSADIWDVTGRKVLLTVECPNSPMKLLIWVSEARVYDLFDEVKAAYGKPVKR